MQAESIDIEDAHLVAGWQPAIGSEPAKEGEYTNM